MKTIIVPVDFSKNSDTACEFAIGLANDMKSRIILVHAFETTVLYSKLPLMTTQLDYSYLYNGAVKKLKEFYKKISKSAKGIEIELSIQQGLPSSRIAELALEKKAELIVMGTTGKGAVERMFFGSNALRIIRNSPCMVLAVPPKATYDGFKRIVYATDLSKDNLQHANRLIHFASKFNSEIMFLNIGEDSAKSGKKDLKKLQLKIKDIVKYHKTSGYITDDDNVPRGTDYFLKYHKADCLAVYTHARGLFSRLFGASVTKVMSFHASIPLLVIHEHDTEEEPAIAPKKHLNKI